MKVNLHFYFISHTSLYPLKPVFQKLLVLTLQYLTGKKKKAQTKNWELRFT